MGLVMKSKRQLIFGGQTADAFPGRQGWSMFPRLTCPALLSVFPRMKTSNVILALLAAGSLLLPAAQTSTAPVKPAIPDQTGVPAPTAYQVVEQGANHRVWQRETYEKSPTGQIIPHIHKYTELATGLNYLSNGQWVESKEEIDAYATGAIANQGPYQVIFANNLNSAGSIDMQTTDGKRLRSSILGLAYYDSSSGQSVTIAQIQDSTGEQISANQVLYPNAFTGVKADVRYTYKKGSFEQDVILREQPPTPESLGLNSQTTVLEVLTEFINPPDARVAQLKQLSSLPPDDEVIWGAARIGTGRAFDLGEPQSSQSHVAVSKHYVTEQGRHILIETVPVKAIQASISQLPMQSMNHFKSQNYAGKKLILPQTPLARVTMKSIQMATTLPSNKGYVLDYVEVHITDYSDFTFQADTTYVVTGDCWFYDDLVTIEGGTVVKFDTSTDVGCECWGNVNCLTSPYHPAVFTSRNDDTVGETTSVSGESMYYTSKALGGNPESQVQWHDLRFSYALYDTFASIDMTVSDSQFVNCGYAITCDGTLTVTNILIVNASNGFRSSDCAVTAYQVTVDSCTNLTHNWAGGTDSTLTLVNSLLVNVGSFGDSTVTTNYVACPSPGEQVFQPVGAGGHYLAINSRYRSAGTTSIDPGVLADIATKTTYPPIVYSNITISVPTTWSPQAERDNVGNPDLGYHYDPLDYVFGGVDAASNVTFTAGTAVGWFELPGSNWPYSPGYGISLPPLAVANYLGTVTSPCVQARYSSVQEGGNGLWTDKQTLGGIVANGGGGDAAHATEEIAAFTDFALLSNDGNNFRDYYSDYIFRGNHCEFWSGGQGGYGIRMYVTNCLFDGSYIGVEYSINPGESGLTMRNCTMRESYILTAHYSGTTWPTWIQNCAFEGTDLSSMDDPSGGDTNITYCDFNAFLTNEDRLPILGSHDVTNVMGFNWQSSWFGNYYLPTNSPLIRAGSTTADQVGLYHFTTQTNQVPETNSIVDIGYHYVATDAYGNPLDSNGDGIPDYLEDANGDGIFDAGDLGDWQVSPYGLNGGNALQVFTPLKP